MQEVATYEERANVAVEKMCVAWVSPSQGLFHAPSLMPTEQFERPWRAGLASPCVIEDGGYRQPISGAAAVRTASSR